MPVSPAHRRLGWGDLEEFGANLGYMARAYMSTRSGQTLSKETLVK